jgi:hypothetical protein
MIRTDRYISPSMVKSTSFISGISISGRIIAFILLFLLSTSGYRSEAQANKTGYEEIAVIFQVENLGSFYSSALYTTDGKLYIAVEELFQNLKIPFSLVPGKEAIEGFLGQEEDRYSINYRTGEITFHNNSYASKEAIIMTAGTGYLESSAFSSILGIDISFSFRSLSAIIKTNFELQAVKEKRLEAARKRIFHGTEESFQPDTIIKRDYHGFRFGMADWYVMSNQIWGRSTDIQAGIGLGAEILGGETDIYLNYSDKFKFDSRMQNYSWRWVDNNKNIVKQVRVGRVLPQTISSLYYPIVGASVSNTPTTTRKAMGEYTVKDVTEPDWLVELYINNELVDYTRADASGMYMFKVPLVYGFTTLTLRFYGPLGEERSESRTINIPYNFMPAGEFEYNFTAGYLQDGKTTPFARAEGAYGILRNLTASAGMEYLSSISGKPAIPFLKISYLPFSKLILTGEYDHGVRIRSTANFYPVSSVLVEADYIKYFKEQKAILYNYQEERKISVSIPGRVGNMSGFARLGYKQNVYSNFNYNIAELLLSGYYRSFTANISTYANWMNDKALYVNSTAALSLRLKYGITLRSTVQLDLTRGKLLLYKEEIEKRFSKNGFISLFYEDNLVINNRSINLNMKFDLNFAQASSSVKVGRNEISTYQGLRGSLMAGRKTKMIQVSESSNVGRGGLTIIPFLDINHNGRRDANERHVENLNVKVSGGKIKYLEKDTVISITGLEPFISYDVEMADKDFENIAWRIEKKRYQVLIDPNQFKIIEVPVVPAGEVSGMIILRDGVLEKGLGRITVRIFDNSGRLKAETLSEQDGYWSYLGLDPGDYYSITDSLQMARLNITASGQKQHFTIKADRNGDIAGNINFDLNYSSSLNQDMQNVPDSTGGEPGLSAASPDNSFNRNIAEFKGDKDNLIAFETGKTTSGNLYYIQAGAFQNSTSGKQVARKLRRISNYAFAFIKQDNLNKLRVGYFRKKYDAEEFRMLLQKGNIESYIGSDSAFVLYGNLDLHAGDNFVQTGAFRTEEFARLYLRRIAGLTKYPVGIIIEDGYYKVRIGYFRTAAEAKTENRNIRKADLESFRSDKAYYSR